MLNKLVTTNINSLNFFCFVLTTIVLTLLFSYKDRTISEVRMRFTLQPIIATVIYLFLLGFCNQ